MKKKGDKFIKIISLGSKNKKAVSPLIATVLIIGFTIVLAALVITWGTKLFKGTVADTDASSKSSLACSTDLDLEVVSTNVTNTSATNAVIALTLRNNKPEKQIDDFLFLIYSNGTTIASGDDSSQASTAGSGGTTILTFPTPKVYTITVNIIPAASVAKIEIFPRLDINGKRQACNNPTTVKLK